MEQALKNCIMTEDTFKDLCLCGETTKVQFKESFTSQKEIAKEMIAFANTKGGVILFGVEDKYASTILARSIKDVSLFHGRTLFCTISPVE